MGTRAYIGILTKENTVKFAYCHWHGYIESVGSILHENYANHILAQDLISRGGMAFLGESLSKCDFYGDNKPEEVSFKKFFDKDRYSIEYCYLFVPADNCWYVALQNSSEVDGLKSSEQYPGFYLLDDLLK